MPHISMRKLLESGVHFGHQTKRWNPKMKPYIYGARNGIHIVDLGKTVVAFDKAYDFVADVVASGAPVLFVGTKRQAQDVIAEEATRAGQFFITERWLGGTLTNWKTIRSSIENFAILNAWQPMARWRSFRRKKSASSNANAKNSKNLWAASKI